MGLLGLGMVGRFSHNLSAVMSLMAMLHAAGGGGDRKSKQHAQSKEWAYVGAPNRERRASKRVAFQRQRWMVGVVAQEPPPAAMRL
jgi:hypothetical protein